VPRMELIALMEFLKVSFICFLLKILNDDVLAERIGF